MNPTAVSLRPVEPDDLEPLFRIDQACFPRGVAYSRAALREFLAIHGSFCTVAEEGRVIQGFVIAEADAAFGHIITLDVLAAFRRRGVGTVLLEAAEKELWARGVKQIHLETGTTNEPAVAFWKKHGYRIQAVLKNYYSNRQDAFVMHKRPSMPIQGFLK